MATVRFYLKNKHSEVPTPIMMCFFYEKKRIRVSTHEKVHPNNWNEKEQMARRSEEGYEALNESLKKLSEDYLKSYRILKSIGATINSQAIFRQYDTVTNAVNKDGKTLTGFIKDFIENSKLRVEEGTTKSYKTTQAVLVRYKQYKNCGLDFNDITLNFRDDFDSFLQRKLNYTKNTAGKHIKNVKVFMKEAHERGLHHNMEFTKKGFKVGKEDVDNIYLTEEELELICDLDLSGDKKLDEIRSLFLVGSWTGLRFSDFTQIRKENISNDIITIKTKKTGELVSVPVHPIIKKIMEKYKGKYASGLPPAYANQVMNNGLKIIGEMAGLNETVYMSRTKGGKKVESTPKKFEVITTHTARRSFATNLYKSGMPSLSIMKITGHRSEKNFLRYINMTPRENAEKLKLHWEQLEKIKQAEKAKKEKATKKKKK